MESIEWQRSYPGSVRFAFVDGHKLVDLGVGVLVERCVDRMPVETVGVFGAVSEAVAAVSA